MITLIERDGEALLARNGSFPIPMYSCIAGFVEPGETMEEAVHREVREEVGVELARAPLRRQPALALPPLAHDRVRGDVGIG